MKRCAGLFALAVLVVFSLMLTGCGDKPKDGAQAPAPTATAPKVNMQDGQWEITTTTEMAGMPAGMMKPHTITTCLTQKEPIAKPKDMPSDCKMQDVKIVGNTVTYGMVCSNSSLKGTNTYTGTSFDGASEMMVKQDGKEMIVKMTMKGKYVGPCPAPAAAPAAK